MALKRVWIPSPNFSSRGGSGVRLAVVHTAEGARSARDLAAFMASPSAGVSSHVAIDDEPGSIVEMVHRQDKAWTQANYNPQCVSAELCAAPIQSSYPCGANWDAAEWNRHEPMIRNVADWVREECEHYGLPITKLTASEAQGSAKGVCGHVELGQGGGGHWDPGPNYPWERTIELARGGSAPAPTPEQEGTEMIASAVAANGTLHVWWVDDNRRTIRYKYQRGGETAWIDGGVFCSAGRDILGLSASLTQSRITELFARLADGHVYHTWQRPSETTWAGAAPGQKADLFLL